MGYNMQILSALKTDRSESKKHFRNTGLIKFKGQNYTFPAIAVGTRSDSFGASVPFTWGLPNRVLLVESHNFFLKLYSASEMYSPSFFSHSNQNVYRDQLFTLKAIYFLLC